MASSSSSLPKLDNFNEEKPSNFSAGVTEYSNDTKPTSYDGRIINAIPLSFMLPEKTDASNSNGTLTAATFASQASSVSIANPVPSQSKRKRRELKGSVVVNTRNFNFNIPEELLAYIERLDQYRMLLDEENDAHMASHHLTASQRLEGWTCEERKRNKSSVTDKFFMHNSLSKTFRSMVEVFRFITYGYPYTRKRVKRTTASPETAMVVWQDNSTNAVPHLEGNTYAIGKEILQEYIDAQSNSESTDITKENQVEENVMSNDDFFWVQNE